MAYAAQYTVSAPKVSFFADLKAKYALYQEFRKTVSELSDLTNRELADLGLSRSGIKGIALETVYGK